MSELARPGLAPAGIDDDDSAMTRPCGRCRTLFPADPGRIRGTLQEWWICSPCRSSLFGSSA